MAIKINSTLKNQSGTALVVALIMMVVITLIALASSYTSIFEINLSGNKRGKTNAFFVADGGVNAIQNHTAAFDLDPALGYFTLMTGSTSTYQSNPFATGNPAPNPTSATATVEYYSNETGAPRGTGTTAVYLNYAYYQIIVEGRDTVGSAARAQISQDVTRLLPVE
jgi:type IV pilus assembly protein PilX